MPQYIRQSGMGLPHSTTLARPIARHSFREVARTSKVFMNQLSGFI
jgi:hypothetical protein